MKYIFLLLFFSTSVFADTQYITIPGEGWHLKVDSPAFTNVESSMRERVFRYIASSIETGVTLSVNTKLEGASTNTECRETNWKKNLTNPMLTKGSEKLFEKKGYLFSSYRSEGEYKGKHFKTANTHAYISRNGICADIHVSHWPYDENSEDIVSKIIQSVTVIE